LNAATRDRRKEAGKNEPGKLWQFATVCAVLFPPVVRKKETRWPDTGKEVADWRRADENDLDACVEEVAKSIGRTAEIGARVQTF
jgi:hypothetical protein